MPQDDFDPLMPHPSRRTECGGGWPRLLIAVGGNAIHTGRGRGYVETAQALFARVFESVVNETGEKP